MSDAYIEKLFAREDEVLTALRDAMRERSLPEIYISAMEGRFLQVLLRAVNARRVLEIGTLGGYSAIWMARALPDNGRLLSLELDPARADLAREYIDRAGLSGVVEVRTGDARAILAEFDDERFDVCFIDADKGGYPEYLTHAVRLVRPGGLILGDNALWSGKVAAEAADDDTRAIQEFNRRLAGPDFVATILPIRDGLAVAVLPEDESEGPRGDLLGLPPIDIVSP